MYKMKETFKHRAFAAVGISHKYPSYYLYTDFFKKNLYFFKFLKNFIKFIAHIGDFPLCQRHKVVYQLSLCSAYHSHFKFYILRIYGVYNLATVAPAQSYNPVIQRIVDIYFQIHTQAVRKYFRTA